MWWKRAAIVFAYVPMLVVTSTIKLGREIGRAFWWAYIEICIEHADAVRLWREADPKRRPADSVWNGRPRHGG